MSTLDYKEGKCSECYKIEQIAFIELSGSELCTDCMATWEVCRNCGEDYSLQKTFYNDNFLCETCHKNISK